MYYRFLAIFSHCFSGPCRVAVCFVHPSGFPSKPMIYTMSSFSDSSSMVPSNPVPDCRDGKAYSKPVYEASPLDRVLEQYGPGEEWHDNGKRVKTEYLGNTADGELSCRWYRTTDTRGDVQVSSNPGKCITRQALVQGVGKR